MRTVLRTSSLLLVLLSLCPSALGDVRVSARNRPVTVRVPETYDPEVPAPLILLLHGYTSNGTIHEGYMNFSSLSDPFGFLFAHPEGTNETGATHDTCGGDCCGTSQFWNATDACCDYDNSGVDDSGYLRSLTEEIESVLAVDPDRIYLVGHSNGGFMAHRMACDHADRIAAIASLAGATFLDPDDCNPSSPVHVLEIRGSDDDCVRYEGGLIRNAGVLEGNPYPGGIATVEQWAAFNGCTLEPEELDEALDIDINIAGAETSIRRHVSGCSATSELWTISGGNHIPSISCPSPCALTSDGRETTTLAYHIVDWLLSHPKRTTPLVARFAVTPQTGTEPLEVEVDASLATTTDPDHPIVSYRWIFGDGATAEGPVATHTYTSSGRYYLRLTVKDDLGRRADTRSTVVVEFRSEEIAPWTAEDIGEPETAGGARFERDCLRFLAGPGVLRNRSGDAFHFLHQRMAGNFRFTARLTEWDFERSGALAGLTIRESLEANSRHAGVALEKFEGDFRHEFMRRERVLTRLQDNDVYQNLDLWLRLERRGDVIAGQLSVDGKNWTEPDEVELADLPEEVHVGLALVAAGDDPTVATFCDLSFLPLREPETEFLRGDCNDNGEVDISDGQCILDWRFSGAPAPGCLAATNTNGDGQTNIADAIYLFGALFLGGPPPVQPFPACGPGTEADAALGCDTSACE